MIRPCFISLLMKHTETGLSLAYDMAINEMTSEALLWFNQRQTTLRD
jgi:hypothetical protein